MCSYYKKSCEFENWHFVHNIIQYVKVSIKSVHFNLNNQVQKMKMLFEILIPFDTNCQITANFCENEQPLSRILRIEVFVDKIQCDIYNIYNINNSAFLLESTIELSF